MLDKKQILYIDDEDINLFLFKQLLKKKYEIFTATSADDGLYQLNSNQNIKIVITDMNMPIKNGLEFIHEAQNKFSRLHYIMFSGFDITQEIEKEMKNGTIKHFVKKPLEIQSMITAIESFVQ